MSLLCYGLIEINWKLFSLEISNFTNAPINDVARKRRMKNIHFAILNSTRNWIEQEKINLKSWIEYSLSIAEASEVNDRRRSFRGALNEFLVSRT